MFTGIVKGVGTLLRVTEEDDDVRLEFSVDARLMDGSRAGDSMCVAGVCLTMLEPGPRGFAADVSAETLHKTTLGDWAVGHKANLEPALAAADRLGGHLVSGHVDGRATLASRAPQGRSERFTFELPAALGRYVAEKGSICLDGVSLTVNELRDGGFEVCIIPHTLQSTTLGALREGDAVNVEVDMVARYIERLLPPTGAVR